MNQYLWEKTKGNQMTLEHEVSKELIYIIKTKFKDRYIVVFESVWEIDLGTIKIGPRHEIEKIFGVSLEELEK